MQFAQSIFLNFARKITFERRMSGLQNSRKVVNFAVLCCKLNLKKNKHIPDFHCELISRP